MRARRPTFPKSCETRFYENDEIFVGIDLMRVLWMQLVRENGVFCANSKYTIFDYIFLQDNIIVMEHEQSLKQSVFSLNGSRY